MRILIITMNVGRTAPGIVFERVIQGLSKIHDVDLLTADLDASFELPNVKNIVEIKSKRINPRIQKLFISSLSFNPVDLLWAKKAAFQLKENNWVKHDLILSFMAFNHYAALIAGNSIAKKLKLKHIVYSVDAIPAPIGWLKDDLFYKGTKRFIAKHLSKVDGLFSANQKMLDYQLTTFQPKNNMVTEVIYNPSCGDLMNYDHHNNNKYTFLYTGGIYGPRKPQYVLEAFKRILTEFPDSTLEFVGTKLPGHHLENFNDEDKGKVFVHPFVKDLTPYYKRATALIDIDSVLPNDIFLSSKIINYITINRIIISETGDNSPSRNIFKGIPSILQCGHDVQEIANAMRLAIQKYNTISYTDRAKVISMFSLNSVIAKINNVICV